MVGERGTGVQCTAIGSNIGGAHRMSYQLPLRQIEGRLIGLAMQNEAEMAVGSSLVDVASHTLSTCHESCFAHLMQRHPLLSVVAAHERPARRVGRGIEAREQSISLQADGGRCIVLHPSLCTLTCNAGKLCGGIAVGEQSKGLSVVLHRG